MNALQNLNATEKALRLQALRELAPGIPPRGDCVDVNNHIHTTYSFSPYSPTKALYCAYTAGLCTAGIMDHDSIAGAEEFMEAGQILQIPTTVGMELRVDFSATPFAGRRINNTDQDSCAYIALHGVPHQSIAALQQDMEPYRQARFARNSEMTARINARLPKELALDYDRDVASLAMPGGTVTERHLLYALALRLTGSLGKGQPVIDFLQTGMGITVSGKILVYLQDVNNPLYEYDLLGALKSDVSAIYIPATKELMPVKEALALSKRLGAIAAYAYLGDVGDSVTGDKRTQAFEDCYLDELVPYLKEIGFNAVTYMPSRNSDAQLERIMALCEQYELFQISGEDINSPRQLFICQALKNPACRHLITATWALIGHEQEASKDLSRGMFSPETAARFPRMKERLAHFDKLGRELGKNC